MADFSQLQQSMRKAFKTPEEQPASPGLIQQLQDYFSKPKEVQPNPTPAPQLDQQFAQGVQQGFSNLSPEEQAKRQALIALQQRGGF